jgi:hypothetical protein
MKMHYQLGSGEISIRRAFFAAPRPFLLCKYYWFEQVIYDRAKVSKGRMIP